MLFEALNELRRVKGVQFTEVLCIGPEQARPICEVVFGWRVSTLAISESVPQLLGKRPLLAVLAHEAFLALH